MIDWPFWDLDKCDLLLPPRLYMYTSFLYSIRLREWMKLSVFITKRWRRLILLLFTSSNCMYLINPFSAIVCTAQWLKLKSNVQAKSFALFYWPYIRIWKCWKLSKCCRHSIGDFSYFIKRWAQSVVILWIYEKRIAVAPIFLCALYSLLFSISFSLITCCTEVHTDLQKKTGKTKMLNKSEVKI